MLSNKIDPHVAALLMLSNKIDPHVAAPTNVE